MKDTATEARQLIDAVRVLFHAATSASERLHADGTVSVGMRAVLEYLARNGHSPVPEIARSRSVSRQHIQKLVNALMEQGLVETRPNPTHRRSQLIAPTARGEDATAAFLSSEDAYLTEVCDHLSPADLARAREILISLTCALRPN